MITYGPWVTRDRSGSLGEVDRWVTLFRKRRKWKDSVKKDKRQWAQDAV